MTIKMEYLVFFNELCLRDGDTERLSKPRCHALGWLSQFVDLLVALSVRHSVGSLRAPRQVMQHVVIEQYSLGRLLSVSTFERDKRTRFRLMLDRAPEWLDELPVAEDDGVFTQAGSGHIYLFDGQVALGLGAAALQGGACVSLNTHSCWESLSIRIVHADDARNEEMEVAHLYDAANLGSRVYEPNPKHRSSAPEGAYASPMPLNATEAQQLLDAGVQPEGMNAVYCWHENAIIVFRPHNLGRFHGYKVKVDELHSSDKPRVLAALRNAGRISQADYDRMIH